MTSRLCAAACAATSFPWAASSWTWRRVSVPGSWPWAPGAWGRLAPCGAGGLVPAAPDCCGVRSVSAIRAPFSHVVTLLLCLRRAGAHYPERWRPAENQAVYLSSLDRPRRRLSAPEHLGGNHPQGPHDDRIAHGLDKPGLGAHLLLHHVRMLPPGVIGHPHVLVGPELVLQRVQSDSPAL